MRDRLLVVRGQRVEIERAARDRLGEAAPIGGLLTREAAGAQRGVVAAPAARAGRRHRRPPPRTCATSRRPRGTTDLLAEDGAQQGRAAAPAMRAARGSRRARVRRRRAARARRPRRCRLAAVAAVRLIAAGSCVGARALVHSGAHISRDRNHAPMPTLNVTTRDGQSRALAATVGPFGHGEYPRRGHRRAAGAVRRLLQLRDVPRVCR